MSLLYNKPFMVKVTKSGVSTYWYAHRIGEIFEVIKDRDLTGLYVLKEDCNNDAPRIILAGDCEEVKAE
jgi:hypothetical protein